MRNVVQGLMLVISLLACYFPAVAGAHGRGSRKVWIGLICIGLFVAAGALILGHLLLGPFDPIFLSNDESFARQLMVYLLAMTVRASISFCFGSFLATLLYRKRQAGLPSVLGLGSETNSRHA